MRIPASPSIRTPALSRPLPRKRHHATPLPKSLVYGLRILISLLVIHYEYITFYSHASSCQWDDSPTFSTLGTKRLSIKEDNAASGGYEGIQPFHSLVLADPQLLDMRSYPGRNRIARRLGIWVTDSYARKSWSFVIGSKGSAGRGVDGVVWMGDLLDSGVHMIEKDEHASYVHRFHLLFPLPRSTTTPTTLQHASLSPPIPSIYLPGNHDLGLHLASEALAEYARERFVESFGATNGEIELGGWSFIWVDSMALLESGEIAEQATNFVEGIAARGPTKLPRVLLIHIPLYRAEGTSCGPGRESRRGIRQGEGLNYQNELDEKTSNWLLKSLNPTLVYSGDDHDSCIIDHPFSSPTSLITSVRETTVKAFSMAMGVRSPGYHLLSLYPPSPTLPPSSPAKYTQTNCLLPDQIGIWLNVYFPAFLGLLVGLLVRKGVYWSKGQMRRTSSTARSNGLLVHSHSRSLSRKVLGVFGANGSGSNGSGGGRRGLDDEGEADDQFSRFPTFDGINSAYHSGIDDEAPLMAHGGREGGMEKRPQRVRRVSRVWAWEKGGFFSSLGAGLEDDGVTGGRGLTSSDIAGNGGRGEESWLYYLGPIHRYIIRPLVRTVRIMSRRMARSPLGGLVGKVVETVLNDSVRELLGDLWRVCWIGFVWWFGINLSFMF